MLGVHHNMWILKFGCLDCFYLAYKNSFLTFSWCHYRSVALIKSDKDNRYGLDSVVTHDGTKMACWALSELSSFHDKLGIDAYNKVWSKTRCLNLHDGILSMKSSTKYHAYILNSSDWCIWHYIVSAQLPINNIFLNNEFLRIMTVNSAAGAWEVQHFNLE